MKKIFFVLLVFLFIEQAAGMAVEWRQIPVNPELDLLSVTFINSKVGYITGVRQIEDKVEGVLLATKDGGATWDSTICPPITRVNFVNENLGYACSWNGPAFKTTDGGKTWNTLDNFRIGSDLPTAIHFINDTLGFLGGTYLGSIVRTTDGGETATNAFTDNFGGSINQFHFLTPEVGYANGELYMLKTVDGGLNWTKIYKNYDGNDHTIYPSIMSADLFFFSEYRGIVVGDSMKVLTTNDGGLNWTLDRIQLPIPPETDLHAVHFINHKVGYAVGSDGVIIKTPHGGHHWTLEHYDSSTPKKQLHNIFCTDNGTCFAIGKGVLMTNAPVTSVGNAYCADFEVLPNPASTNITVGCAPCLSQQAVVQLFDTMGKAVTEVKTFSPEAENYRANLMVDTLSDGIYFLRLQCGTQVFTRKINLIH